MPKKPNYNFEKRQKELARDQKREAKAEERRRRKRERQAEESGGSTDDPDAPVTPPDAAEE